MANNPQLEWKTAHVEELNCVRVEINKAAGRRGLLYSFRLLRHDRGRDSNYCRAPHDGGDAIEAIRRAGVWIEKDRRETS